MLGITLIHPTRGHVALSLDPATTATLTFECPIFDPQYIDRAYTYPFRIPANAHNLTALAHPTRLDIITHSTFQCYLTLGSIPIHPQPATLRIGGHADGLIDITIQSASIDIVSQLSTLRLRQRSTTVSVAGRLQATFEFRCIITESDWASALYERIAIGINGRTFTSPANLEPEDLATAINAVYPDLATAYFDPSELPDIYFYLTLDHAAVDTLTVVEFPTDVPTGDTAYFSLIGADLGTEALRIAAAYQDLIEDEGTTDIRFPVVDAPNLYDTRNTDYTGLANYTNPLGTHPTPDIGTPVTTTGWPHTLLPLPTMGGIFDWLATQGYTITGTFPTSAEGRALLLWHNRPADYFLSAELITPARRPTTLYRTYPPILQLAQYTPDITAWDLLQRYLATFLHILTITPTRQLQLTSVAELLSTPPLDLTHTLALPTATNIVYPAGYTLDYDRQRDDTPPPATQLQRLDGGPEATTYTLPIYTAPDITLTDSLPTEPRIWLLPSIPDTGQSTHFALTTAPTLRLLFYRGPHTASDASTYLLAQHGTRSYTGTATGTYSIDWLTPTATGIYGAWYRRLITILQHGRTITVSMQLPPHTLMQLLTWRQPRIHLRTPTGSITAVIRTIRIRANTTQLFPTTLTLQQEP